MISIGDMVRVLIGTGSGDIGQVVSVLASGYFLVRINGTTKILQFLANELVKI
jgi:ribosomal protein L24